MKNLVSRFLSFFGIGIVKTNTLARLRESELKYYRVLNTLKFEGKFANSVFKTTLVKRALQDSEESQSQIYQDLVCLMFMDFKVNGFFVEFGASDGVRFSNTYLLEKKYGWNGILAEPARKWHGPLKKNRNSIVDTRCVYRKTGELLKFNETHIGELSTVDSYSFSDSHADLRKNGLSYTVETVSLSDLLQQNSAPAVIDFLSIDTEGSEFEILLSFDFSKYTFNFISCEHNFSANRERVFELLSLNGYKRVLPEVSEFDDWYLHESITQN